MRKGMTMHNETSRMAKFRFNGEEFSHIEHLTEVESDDSLPTDPYDLQWVFAYGRGVSDVAGDVVDCEFYTGQDPMYLPRSTSAPLVKLLHDMGVAGLPTEYDRLDLLAMSDGEYELDHGLETVIDDMRFEEKLCRMRSEAEAARRSAVELEEANSAGANTNKVTEWHGAIIEKINKISSKETIWTSKKTARQNTNTRSSMAARPTRTMSFA